MSGLTADADPLAAAMGPADHGDSDQATSESRETGGVSSEPQGGSRALKDIHEITLVGEAQFSLDAKTEEVFERLTREHFVIFQHAPATALEEWQAKFIDVFRKRVEAAAGNKALDSLPEDERNKLIAQEARNFAADNKNLQVLVKIDEFNLEALQRGLRADINTTVALDRNIHVATSDTISGGAEVHRYRGATPLGTISGNIVRKIVGNRAITLPERINELIDRYPGSVRPAILDHLTPAERDAYTSEVQKRQVRNATNKTTPYTVVFPPSAGRTVDFTGLSPAQKLLLQSYGLREGDNYEIRTNPLNREETLTTVLERRIKELTKARVDYYTKTGFDIYRMKFNFRDTARVQDPHSLIEREAYEALLAAGPVSPEILRLEINKRIVTAVEQNTTRLLAEAARKRQEEREHAIVQKKIEKLGNSKTEEQIAAERAQLEADKKKEDERLKRAQEREELERQRTSAQVVVKAVEDGYADAAERQADFDVYDNWPAELKAVENTITALEAADAEYAEVATAITTLKTELENLYNRLAGMRNVPEKKKDGDQKAPGGATIPPIKEVVDKLNQQIDRVQEEINAQRARFPERDGKARIRKDAQGNPIFIDIAARRGRIAAQLVREQAKKVSLQNGPAGWDADKIARVKNRKDNLAEIARLNNRITNGITDGTFPTESSQDIEKKIADLDKRITEVRNPDKYLQNRREAHIVLRDYVMSSDAIASLSGRLALMRARALPYPESRYYENWPKVYMRAIQGAFGEDALIDPDIFDRVSRGLLPPEKFMALYNQRYPTAPIADRTALAAFDPTNLTAEDVAFIVRAIKREGVTTENLAVVPPAEQNILAGFTTVSELPSTEKPDETVVQQLERFHYYYRDLADLQLRILKGWTHIDGLAADAYLVPSNDINREKIQWAARYAQEVDRRRKQRLAQFYGNPESSTPVARATPEPTLETPTP